jgi:hypothetical protein
MPNTCCNLDCNQGRNCPLKADKQERTVLELFEDWIFGFLFGVLMVASLIGIIRLFLMVLN